MICLAKVGLVLEGGANRGIFTAGVLDCLKEHNIYLPYVVSVSVGTCNAIDYISRQVGRTKTCMIPKGRNTPPICWRNIFTKKSIINLDLVFDEYPNHLVPFDYETFWNSDIVSEYVVTNCLTGKAEYFSVPEYHNAKKLMAICRASCSMPYLLPEIYLDGVPYLDGGCADPIPFEHAIKQGYEKNIVVATRDHGYSLGDKARWMTKLDSLIYKKYPNFAQLVSDSNRRYREILRKLNILEQQGKLLVIRPMKVLVSRLDNNENRLEEFYKQGYDIAKSRLDEIHRFIG